MSTQLAPLLLAATRKLQSFQAVCRLVQCFCFKLLEALGPWVTHNCRHVSCHCPVPNVMDEQLMTPCFGNKAWPLAMQGVRSLEGCAREHTQVIMPQRPPHSMP